MNEHRTESPRPRWRVHPALEALIRQDAARHRARLLAWAALARLALPPVNGTYSTDAPGGTA